MSNFFDGGLGRAKRQFMYDAFEKAKAFPIGSIDKNGLNVKTANGWVPLKKNKHLVDKDHEPNHKYKHLYEDGHTPEKKVEDEGKQKDNTKEVEKKPEAKEEDRPDEGKDVAEKDNKPSDKVGGPDKEEQKVKRPDNVPKEALDEIDKLYEGHDKQIGYHEDKFTINHSAALSAIQMKYFPNGWSDPASNTGLRELYQYRQNLNNVISKRQQEEVQAKKQAQLDRLKASGVDVDNPNLDFADLVKNVPDKRDQKALYDKWLQTQSQRLGDKVKLELPWNENMRKMFKACSDAGVNVNGTIDHFYSNISKIPDKYFVEVLKYRGQLKMNKKFDGAWGLQDVRVLRNMEEFAAQLPNGHYVNNEYLTRLAKHTDNMTYAHYEGRFSHSKSGTISFSSELSYKGQRQGDLKNPGEFEHVVAHELGHAVSKKLSKYSAAQYIQFGEICGWAYEDVNKYAGALHSGGIPRKGVNKNRKLVSNYASMSVEESFAEHYAMYLCNKERIDNWLKEKKSPFENYSGMAVVFKDGRNSIMKAHLEDFRPIFEFMRDKVFRDRMIKSFYEYDGLDNNFNPVELPGFLK